MRQPVMEKMKGTCFRAKSPASLFEVNFDALTVLILARFQSSFVRLIGKLEPSSFHYCKDTKYF